MQILERDKRKNFDPKIAHVRVLIGAYLGHKLVKRVAPMKDKHRSNAGVAKLLGRNRREPEA